MLKKEYKNRKNTIKSNLKDAKRIYKAERPPLKERIVSSIKSFVIKIKKIYGHIFRAWYLIVELKDEILKLKNEVEE